MNSYRITFRFYDISPRTAYIKAENMADANYLAHKFITPDDDCREIIVERIAKVEVPEYTPVHRIREERTAQEMDWATKALIYAEQIGIYEYAISGTIIQYWSFYGQNEGWLFIQYDLAEEKEIFRGANIPWMGYIPEFLKDPVTGATRYNYMCG